MTLGVLALIFGMTIGPAPIPASASPALQPSPRPTLQPTPDLTQLTPTPTPPPPVVETDVPEREPTAVPMGRVTGTVIDLRTNAPAANKLVAIGDFMVLSDASGNYDRWVESGYYRLDLELGGGEGAVGQPAQEIAVGPGDTVVVHLFFTSPAPATAVPASVEPVAAPSEPVAAPAEPAVPGSSAEPVAAPAEPAVPGSSAEQAVIASLPARAENAAPGHLPHTAAPVELVTPALWVVGGMLLLAFGVTMQLMPRRRRAAQRALLGSLLSSAPPARRRTPEELLRDLLNRDM